MSVAAAVLNNTFRGQFVRNGSHVYTNPLFVANWGNDSVDGTFVSAPTSNSDTPTGTSITINGTNQVWQARYPFNSNGTLRIDFYPLLTPIPSGQTYFIICGTYINVVSGNLGISTNNTGHWGIGIVIFDGSGTTNFGKITSNGRFLKNGYGVVNIIIKNYNAILYGNLEGVSSFVRVKFFDSVYFHRGRGDALSSLFGLSIQDCIFDNISRIQLHKTSQIGISINNIFNNIPYFFDNGYFHKNCFFNDVEWNYTPVYYISPTLTKYKTNTLDSCNNLGNNIDVTTTINTISTNPLFNSIELKDYTYNSNSPHFKSGNIVNGPHIANAIYGIPIYNATAFTTKDSSLPTITANGFTMSSFKDFNTSSGTISLNFRISQINLVGAENLIINFTDLDSSGNFTLGTNHDAPTDETGTTNDGTGDHKTGFVGGYFTFRKTDGTTVLSSKFLSFNQPIGFDDTGKIWGDTGFAGTVVKVGNRLYSDFVTWTATTFNSGDYVEYEGKPYKANVNTLSTDVPGVSSKWDTWNPYIEAAEVQVELKYPNGGGLDFKGVTFCLKRNEEENITKYFI